MGRLSIYVVSGNLKTQHRTKSLKRDKIGKNTNEKDKRRKSKCLLQDAVATVLISDEKVK